MAKSSPNWILAAMLLLALEFGRVRGSEWRLAFKTSKNKTLPVRNDGGWNGDFEPVSRPLLALLAQVPSAKLVRNS